MNRRLCLVCCLTVWFGGALSSHTLAQTDERLAAETNDKAAIAAQRVAAIESPGTVAQAEQRYRALLEQVSTDERLTARDLSTPLIAALSEAIRRFIDEPDCHLLFALRGDVSIAVGEAEAAIDDYTVAIKRRADVPQYWRARARLWKVEQADAAIRDMSMAVRLAPTNARYINDLAAAYVAAERVEEATGLTALAALQQPDNADLSSNLVSLLRMSGHPEEAIAESDRGLKLKDVPAQAYINRSSALFELNRFQDVLATCQQGLSQWPEDDVLQQQHRNALRRFWEAHPLLTTVSPDKHRLVLTRLDQVLTDDADPLLFYRRGLACCHLGLFERAIVDFRRVLQSRPDLADVTRDLQRAQALQQIPESSPVSPQAQISDNERVLMALQTGFAPLLLDQLSPRLRPFTETTEVERRVARIARHWPPLRDTVVSSVTDHETVGDRQQTITLTFPGDAYDDVSVTIARTADGALLGVEFDSPQLKLGTRTALKGLGQMARMAEQMLQSISDNDAVTFQKLSRAAGASTSEQQALDFVSYASPLIGPTRQFLFADTVVEFPDTAGDDVLVAAIALTENQKGQWFTWRLRYTPAESLQLSAFDFGNVINMKYSRAPTARDVALCRAIVSDDVSLFYNLIHPGTREDFGEPAVRRLLQTARGQLTGAFERIVDGSQSGQVRIENGEYIRESMFAAQYAQETVTLDTEWSLSTLDSYTIGYLYDSDPIFGQAKMGEWLQEPAERDLKQYVAGAPEKALQMLQQYTGFEKQTVESLQGLADTLAESYGPLQSIGFQTAEYDSSSRRWTIRFDLEFEQRKSAGYAVYSLNNADPNLVSIGFD